MTTSRWHNYYLDNHAHFCTTSVAGRLPKLDEESIQVIYEEWEQARQALPTKVLAYCVMPNHYHIVLWSELGENVKKFLHRTNAQTSRRLQPGGGFWKEKPYVVTARSRTVLQTKVDYIHRNPIRAELVRNPEDWNHSSFRQLELGVRDVPFACDDWGGIVLPMITAVVSRVLRTRLRLHATEVESSRRNCV